MGILTVMAELESVLKKDEGIIDFCSNAGGLTLMTGCYDFGDIPIRNIPCIAIIDCSQDQDDKKRFLFSEKEVFIVILCGVLVNDKSEGMLESIRFNELISQAISKDRTLNGSAKYSAVVNSKQATIPHPLYFRELKVYVNYDLEEAAK